jgi:hypothetical protein
MKFKMKWIFNIIIISVAGLLSSELRAEPGPSLSVDGASQSMSNSPVVFNLQADHPGKLVFFGSETADLFTKELDESFKGALALDFVSRPDGKFPLGFLNASPPGQPWYGTMWTRDAGTCMRELVFWGYYAHACQVAQCVMDFVETNSDGFIAFPRCFDPQKGRQSGSEMDGQAATIIAMIALWQRLPARDPFRARLYQFLHQESSPIRGIHSYLKHGPLVPGSGEFGGGSGYGLYDNVVQNNLCALALFSAADMEDEAGDHATSKIWRKDANSIFHNIEKYLVAKDGSWTWCVNTETLKPDTNIVNSAAMQGVGGLNGVTSMSADVLGFVPSLWPWQGELYKFPLRKQQFEKYGIWPQMNYQHDGLLTSPSYGQGYALQDMLLFDKLAMAEHGIDFLAQATYKSPDILFSFRSYHYGRLSPYYFYERMYSPDAPGKMEMTAGCGPLNLVNVSEPLKVARLIAGVDDTSLKEVRIVPRLPPSWSGYRLEDWPVRTSRGMVRIDLSFERTNAAVNVALQVKKGGPIPRLAVRLPIGNGTSWKYQANVENFKFTSADKN